MFEPLSRSRFAPQIVCPSCLSAVIYRSNPSRRRIRYNEVSTVTTASSVDEPNGMILSSPPKTRHTQDSVGDKVKRGRGSVPKTSLSSNRKVIEELKKALKGEIQPVNPINIVSGHKGENTVARARTNTSADKKTLATDAERVEIGDGEVARLKADKSSDGKGKLQARNTPDTDKDGLTRRVTTDVPGLKPKPKAKVKAKSRLATQLGDFPISSTKTPADHDERNELVENESTDAKLSPSHAKGPIVSTTPLPTPKAVQSGLVRMTPSTSSKSRKVENSNRRLMIALQGNDLNSEEKKLIMSQLRKSLLSGTSKTTQPGKRGPAKRRSRERSKKASVSLSKKSKKSKKMTGSGSAKMQLKEKPGMTAYEIRSIEAGDLDLVPLEKPQPPVPNLAYGLERVLFNPGVYHLRDPRSRVFNFDPYLESIMPVAEFDFNALKEYITSSRDETLLSTAAAEQKKYTGSTSSMTSALAHFHFLLSQWRPVNTSNLSQGFPDKLRTFTQLQRAPSAIFLRWRNGTYAIDADKEFDTANILMMLGKSMEKLLTLKTQDFEKYRKENSDQISEDERNETESFHYTTMGDFLMRSQLDAYDPRIPGTGMFDLKTRAVVSIRMDARNYHNGLGYEIRSRHGEFESYEREYYDMIRAAFLKYSLQVRMGRMDGIFVAFHNTERIFGFQYISLPEMDLALHGQEDLTIGDSEFKLSLELLNRVLDRATVKYPEQSLRIFFETRDTTEPFMYIFAEPVTEEDIQEIQTSKRAEIEHYERTVLGIQAQPVEELEKEEAKAEKSMDNRQVEEFEEEKNADGINDDRAIDSDRPKTWSTGEEVIVFGDQGLDDNLSVLNSTTENTGEDIVGLEMAVQKQLDYGASSYAQKRELELHKSSSLSNEGREDYLEPKDSQSIGNQSTDEPFLDTALTSAKPIDTTRETNRATDIERMDQTSLAEAAGGPDTSQQGKNKIDSKENSSSLLAMTLTIRNKVNGAYVTRPDKIGSDARWSVEYALAEVPTLEQSHNLYQKTQRRRALVLQRDKKDAATNFHQSYARKLAGLSSEGRKWRLKQDEIDGLKPVTVLGDQVDGSQLHKAFP